MNYSVFSPHVPPPPHHPNRAFLFRLEPISREHVSSSFSSFFLSRSRCVCLCEQGQRERKKKKEEPRFRLKVFDLIARAG